VTLIRPRPAAAAAAPARRSRAPPRARLQRARNRGHARDDRSGGEPSAEPGPRRSPAARAEPDSAAGVTRGRASSSMASSGPSSRRRRRRPPGVRGVPDDAVPLVYQGPPAIGRFLSTVPAGGAARAVPARPHSRERAARLRLLPPRPARSDPARVRAHGPHSRRGPHCCHRLPRYERLPRVRIDVRDQPMFGGLTFMVAGRTRRGVAGDELIVRLLPEQERAALARPHTNQTPNN
jgi:hypothetical protein